MTQLDLTYHAAPTTSGPRPRQAVEVPAGPRDYTAEWSAYAAGDGAEVAAEIEREALALAAAGARRISVAAIFERRRASGVGLNQSWRAACADWLCDRHVALADLIERRKRRAT